MSNKIIPAIAAAALALALPTGAAAAGKNSIGFLLGSGSMNETYTYRGREYSYDSDRESVSSISFNYRRNFTDSHGILVNLTPAPLSEDYTNLSTLYRWTIPMKREAVKPFLAVGLGLMDWNRNSHGLGFGISMGGGADFFIQEDISLQTSLVIQTASSGKINVDQDGVGVSIINVGVFFHF